MHPRGAGARARHGRGRRADLPDVHVRPGEPSASRARATSTRARRTRRASPSRSSSPRSKAGGGRDGARVRVGHGGRDDAHAQPREGGRPRPRQPQHVRRHVPLLLEDPRELRRHVRLRRHDGPRGRAQGRARRRRGCSSSRRRRTRRWRSPTSQALAAVAQRGVDEDRREDPGRRRQHVRDAVLPEAARARVRRRRPLHDEVPERPFGLGRRRGRSARTPRTARRSASRRTRRAAILSPFDSFLVSRGIKTLPVRMRAHDANGRAVAAWLATHPKVKKVFYPGLPSHPGHAVAARQMSGFGGMISFDLGSDRGGEALPRPRRRSARSASRSAASRASSRTRPR